MKNGTSDRRVGLKDRLCGPVLLEMIKCRAKLARLRTQSDRLEKSLDDFTCENEDDATSHE